MGGAVFNEAGTVTINNSTFTGNTAQGGNVGFDVYATVSPGAGVGGGLFNHNGTITITNSTFSLNTAAQGGRDVFNLGDSIGATTDSRSATALISNSILGQSDTSGTDITSTIAGGGGTQTGGTNNLIRTESGFGGLFSSADPLLGALADYGGPTPTMALLPRSPAIDAGAKTISYLNFTAPTTDQRGISRDADNAGAVDIGAFEDGTRAQTIGFGPLSPVTYGVGPITLDALTTPFALPSHFRVVSGPGRITGSSTGNTLTVTGAGNIVIEADQGGNAIIAAAPPVQQTLVVNQAQAVIDVTPYSVPYDGTAHTAAGTAIGVQGEDLSADLTLTGTTHTAMGPYTDTWRFHDPNGNYQDASK
jgi:hypothetical protein